MLTKYLTKCKYGVIHFVEWLHKSRIALILRTFIIIWPFKSHCNANALLQKPLRIFNGFSFSLIIKLTLRYYSFERKKLNEIQSNNPIEINTLNINNSPETDHSHPFNKPWWNENKWNLCFFFMLFEAQYLWMWFFFYLCFFDLDVSTMDNSITCCI